jgi:hypothetical protein
MYGDFARVTFEALKNRSRVLMQQGRVQLEADWNEQGAIFLHLLRALAKDLIGPAGGPEGNCGFAVLTRKWVDGQPDSEQKQKWLAQLPDQNDFLVGKGRYYVDGMLCENPDFVAYSTQPPCFGPGPDKITLRNDAMYLVYLDVAEYSVFSAQDESMLEVAVGIETAIRAQQSWVVRTVPVKSGDACDSLEPSWESLVEGWQSGNRGWLRVRAGRSADDTLSGPCIVAPQSLYRGAENQLYRIEVHRGGVIETKRSKSYKGTTAQDTGERPMFKFSRVNGSAVYRIESMQDPIVTLADLGRDDRFDLDDGNWVEILDDTTILSETPAPLRKVVGVDTFTRKVTLEPSSVASKVGTDPLKHPFMRRWDQRQGDPKGRGLQLEQGVAPIEIGDWMALEDGVEIQFAQPAGEAGRVVFRAGDYWLAPARVATGGIIDWPQDNGEPVALPPHGVEHHYTPLAILKVEKGDLVVHGQCRRVFEIASPVATKPFGTKG